MKNQQKAFDKVIVDKTLINIVINGVLQSYEIKIQGIIYIDQAIFEDVVDKLLIETYRMARRDQKLRQKETLAIQFQCTYFKNSR